MQLSPSRIGALAAGLALTLAACGEAQEPPLAGGFHDLPGFFDCAARTGVVLSAHRGGPAPGYPENALATLAHAAAAGVYLLEVDVQTTRDGELVLFHDDSLERTSTGRGLVAETDFEVLRGYRLRDAQKRVTEEKIPRLSEALTWAKDRAILQLDIKRGTSPDAVVAAVKGAGAETRVVYIAYTQRDAETLARLSPKAMISLSIENERHLDKALASRLDSKRLLAFTGIAAPNAALNRRLRAAGIEPIFGTLGGRDSIDAEAEDTGSLAPYRQVLETGVAILATDRPFTLAQGLEEDDAVLSACLAPHPEAKETPR